MTEAVIIYYLLSKSMDWFLYDDGLRHKRVNVQYITYHPQKQPQEVFCKKGVLKKSVLLHPVKQGKVSPTNKTSVL